MKKSKILAVAVVSAFLLSGCSNQAANFGSTTIPNAPHWDLAGHVKDIEKSYVVDPTAGPTAPPASATASADKISEDTPAPVKPSSDTSPVATAPPTSAPQSGGGSLSNSNIYSDTYILNYDVKNGCKITGQIFYIESYKATWGEEYNSKSYLYNVIAPTEKTLTSEKNININGTQYVSGKYTQPLSYGERPYHMSAARAFSTVFKMPNSTSSGVGPYQSKTDEGVPFVFIDMSCSNEKDITEDNWNKMSGIFQLSFETKSK